MTKKLDMTGWNDKDSKIPECRELYEEHDYITAYGKHTDLRILRPDGAQGAIGRKDEWESHGLLQLAFLQNKGLKPSSRILDIGCGAGRFARRVVPFLDGGHYTGIDISKEILEYAKRLSVEEGWDYKCPRFARGLGDLSGLRPLDHDHSRFDFVWAHSVFTHSPPEVVRSIFTDLAGMDFGVFFFTYKFHTEPRRSGLKQFQYPPEWFVAEARTAGLDGEEIPEKWPAGQRTMKVWKP